MSSDEEEEDKISNFLPPRNKANKKTEAKNNSEKEDDVRLNKDDMARAKMIADRARHVDKKSSYRDKASRREDQESLVNALNEEIKKDENVGTQEKINLLQTTMEQANDAFSKIEINADGKELARDALVIHSMSELLCKNTAALMADRMKRQFSIDKFKDSLQRRVKDAIRKKEKMALENDAPDYNNLLILREGVDYPAVVEDEEAEDEEKISLRQWREIARQASVVIPATVRMSYLDPLFPLDQVEQGPSSKKVKRARGPRDEKEEVVMITQKTQAEHARNEPSVSKELDVVRKHLKKALKQNNGRVSYYHFVIDSNSFGKSVENIFHMSFLIRDCVAKIDLDEDGLPCIYTITEEDRNKMNHVEKYELSETVQAIIPFDYSIWRGMIDALNITGTLIPS